MYDFKLVQTRSKRDRFVFCDNRGYVLSRTEKYANSLKDTTNLMIWYCKYFNIKKYNAIVVYR
jgi:hypothetical protein